MRHSIGLAVALLVLGLTPALQAQTFATTTATSTSGNSIAWQPSSTFAPLQLNTALHGIATGFTNVWNFINPFPAQSAPSQSLYPTVPGGPTPGMTYLQGFGYQVAQPAQ